MTNATIILNARFNLMDSGVIGTTGRQIQFVDGNGETQTAMEPEEIHTYAAWKAMGYQVQKGQKAIAKFSIWKHTSKKNKETGEEEENMFMVHSAFFSAAQVAPV